MNNAFRITVFGALIILSSSLFVRVYGELEFGFGLLKICLVIFINILALVITSGGGPSGEKIECRYWRNRGPFVHTFHSALYAYGGIQAFVIAAAETKNPRQATPQTTKRIFWKVFIFYVYIIFMAGLVVLSNDPNLLHYTSTAARSLFVIAANNARIKAVPSTINAIVVTSAWSSGNSNMLTGSRVLYGMANAGQGPKIFNKINRFGILFTWLQNLVAIGTLTDWAIVVITYSRFYYGCKVQGIDSKKELPKAALLQPFFSWTSSVLFFLLLLTSGYTTFMHPHWSTESCDSSYFNVPFTLALYLGYKFWNKTRIIPLENIPIRGFIDVANANPELRTSKSTGLTGLNVLWS
ncbi:hypothetical protein DOTSEDRAFT_54730 [Dothistroma septosporum NZE10]|uniref:Amino acid permease/ SLC12A domain-containing protein n=1 Tax=Dothistroma septosporum (strain NZE10 / CBS 128990) TaxID=675120 RepID=N1PIX2_DOTSN|nr:hypothetical protein DOTSEDRAFT_54730 [Dothistroma septosporum NZE10]